jgi:valyl-tRNA synthetase
MRLGFCSKSKDIIEPLMRPQWYIKCKDVADVLIEKVQSKEMQILPEEHEKVWY